MEGLLNTQLPSRGAFAKRQRRFVDTQGRHYVLPQLQDSLFQRFVEVGLVSSENYERRLRKGLAFDPDKELVELSRGVLFYVQPPRQVTFESWSDAPPAYDQVSGGQRLSTLPEVSPSKPLVLLELESGALYQGTVERAQATARSKRGLVLVRDVRLINRGQRAQRIPERYQ